MRLPNESLVKEFRRIQRCELCGHPGTGADGLEVHHEPTWGSAHQETRLTLARLHGSCHDPRHSGTTGKETEDKIVALICRREGCSAEDRQMVIDLIWRAPKGASLEWFLVQALEAKWPDSAFSLLERTLDEAGVK